MLYSTSMLTDGQTCNTDVYVYNTDECKHMSKIDNYIAHLRFLISNSKKNYCLTCHVCFGPTVPYINTLKCLYERINSRC